VRYGPRRSHRGEGTRLGCAAAKPHLGDVQGDRYQPRLHSLWVAQSRQTEERAYQRLLNDVFGVVSPGGSKGYADGGSDASFACGRMIAASFQKCLSMCWEAERLPRNAVRESRPAEQRKPAPSRLLPGETKSGKTWQKGSVVGRGGRCPALLKPLDTVVVVAGRGAAWLAR
jgi:hypothetical protein